MKELNSRWRFGKPQMLMPFLLGGFLAAVAVLDLSGGASPVIVDKSNNQILAESLQELEQVRTLTGDPLFDSWIIGASTYARVFLCDSNSTVSCLDPGIPDGWLDSWPVDWDMWRTNSTNVMGRHYAGIERIDSITDYVIVHVSNLPHYIMGPWWNGNRPFPDHPQYGVHPQYAIRRDRAGVMPGPLPPFDDISHWTALSSIGVWVDGVAPFNVLSGYYYNGTNDVLGIGGWSDGLWHGDAVFTELQTFDPAHGHAEDDGLYHCHFDPVGLRHLLSDHVDYDGDNHTYTESSASLEHSPILGWACDGYPIYGPYGYSDATNAASSVTRMKSGYRLRTIGNRDYLPRWAAEMKGRSQGPLGPDAGPPTSAAPLGSYCEDYEYLGHVTNAPVLAYDLDQHNGRWCVTPEYTNGTYAYFCTIDADGNPVFPYILGPLYRSLPDCDPSAIAELPSVFWNRLEYYRELLDPSVFYVERDLGQFFRVRHLPKIEGMYHEVLQSPTLQDWIPVFPPSPEPVWGVYLEVDTTDADQDFLRVNWTGDLAEFELDQTVIPRRAVAGSTIRLSVSLHSSGIPPDGVTPTGVEVGPFVGSDISRDGNAVFSTVTIPSQAVPGPRTVRVTFPPGSGTQTEFSIPGVFGVAPSD